MQIDQCLSCSRYEPIIGQTYDILNEVGANLANIQDDIASGFMNMEDYINWLRIEQMHDKKIDYQLNYKTANKRDPNERPFKDQWDDGVKMGWKLTPVETQKPQINWRQDINSDDKSPQKLASYQGGNGPGTSGLTPTVSLNPGDYKNFSGTHKQFMDDVLAGKFDPKQESGSDNKNDGSGNSTDGSSGDKTPGEETIWWPKAKESIAAGFEMGKKRAEEAVKNLKMNGYEQTLQKACSDAKIDPVMAMAVSAVLSMGDPAKGIFCDGNGKIEDQSAGGANKLKELTSGTKNVKGNPIGPITAWKGWSETLESLLSAPMKVSSKEGTAAPAATTNSTSGRYYNWEWRKALDEANVDPTFFPAVIQAYQVIDASNTGLSQLKNQENNIDFPIDTLGLNKIYWVQDYGVENAGSGVSVVSNGIVFKTEPGIEVHAPEKCDCSTGNDSTLGNFVSLGSMSASRTYIFGGLDTANAPSESSAKAVCGKTTDKFILQVKENGKFVDPKTVWRLLNTIGVSTNTTVGKQIEDINNKGINPDT